MVNLDLVEQLLAVKQNESNNENITQLMISKASEIIGTVISVSPNAKATTPIEVKGKEKKEKMTTEQIQSKILNVIKSNTPIIPPKKTKTTKTTKKTTTTTAKPKATPEESLAVALVKLMDTYKDDVKPLFSTIDIVEGKQVWSNGHFIVRIKDNIPTLDSRMHKPEDKYPDIKKVFDKTPYKEDEVLFDLSSKDIKEFIKGEKSDKVAIIKNVAFGISMLRNLTSLASSIKVYKGATNMAPMYYDTELFDGIVMPCRWDGNIENAKAKGIRILE